MTDTGSTPEESEETLSTNRKSAKGAGTLRKRSDGRWEGRYSIGFDAKTGKQIQKSVYGKNQKEVRQKISQIVTEIDDGSYIEPNTMKLGTWMDIWLQDYTGNVKPATYSAYEEHVRVHIKPYLGDIQLMKLAPHMVQRVYNMLIREKGLSPKSVKNIHGVLHRAVEQAKKLGYLKENPLEAVIVPRVEKKQIKAMEDNDMVSFLQAIKGTRYELVLFVTAFTGLRQGEVLGLTWDCVNFENNTLLINKQHNRVKGDTEFRFSSLKNDKIRVLTVATDVMDALRKQQRLQKQWALEAGSLWDNSSNLVFTNELGRYINNKTLYMNFKKVMASVGLTSLRFHDLRHTYAVNSLKAGDFEYLCTRYAGHEKRKCEPNGAIY